MPNEEVIKIAPAFEDARGAISNVLDKPISHVAVITSKKGSIRANHYHPKQWQYEYLVSGEYESITKDLRKDHAPVERRMIRAGDLVLTPPMVAHTMRFTQDSVMLNMTDGSRDSDHYEEHTKKYPLTDEQGNVLKEHEQ